MKARPAQRVSKVAFMSELLPEDRKALCAPSAWQDLIRSFTLRSGMGAE